jgi:hypothetical protein
MDGLGIVDTCLLGDGSILLGFHKYLPDRVANQTSGEQGQYRSRYEGYRGLGVNHNINNNKGNGQYQEGYQTES